MSRCRPSPERDCAGRRASRSRRKACRPVRNRGLSRDDIGSALVAFGAGCFRDAVPGVMVWPTEELTPSAVARRIDVALGGSDCQCHWAAVGETGECRDLRGHGHLHLAQDTAAHAVSARMEGRSALFAWRVVVGIPGWGCADSSLRGLRCRSWQAPNVLPI